MTTRMTIQRRMFLTVVFTCLPRFSYVDGYPPGSGLARRPVGRGLERRFPFRSDLRDEGKVPALALVFHAVAHEDALLRGKKNVVHQQGAFPFLRAVHQ